MQLPFSQVDEYRLQQLIYDGPNTLVYRGYQAGEQRPVLVKLLRPQATNQEERVRRFQREGRICARLKHPHIVDVYATGQEGDYHYIILEYVDGGNLKDLLARAHPLPLSAALTAADQILQALDYAHRAQIVHRDIKPANIMLNRRGEVKLTDFGLARFEGESELTQPGTILGTLAYMSPEQISGDALDGRADIFAFGCVLYEMLSGRRAFEGPGVSATLHRILNEDPPALEGRSIPPPLREFVEKCIDKDPEGRWQDVAAAREALGWIAAAERISGGSRVLEGLVQAHFPPAADEAVQRSVLPVAEEAQPMSRLPRRLPWWLAGLLVGSLLLAGVFWLNGLDLSEMNPPGNGASAIDSQAASDERLPALDSAKSENPADGLALPPPSLAENEPKIPAPAGSPQIASGAPPKEEMPTGTLRDSTAAATSEPPEASATSTLIVSLDTWAELYLDERRIEAHQGALELAVPPGRHLLRFAHPNFPPHVEPVELAAGERKTVSWFFAQNIGYLWLEVHPWAEIYLDSSYLDTTPLRRPLALAGGAQTLELRHPSYQPQRESVRITSGDTLRVRVALRKLIR